MKIIHAGVSKTGTNSFVAALKIMGLNVCGFFDHHKNWKVWHKILTTGGTTDDFYQLFKDADVIAQIPVFFFWDEILKAFPDAKVDEA